MSVISFGTDQYFQCSIVARCRDRTTREIVEAEKICSLKDVSVSTPSVAITDKEKLFLCLSVSCTYALSLCFAHDYCDW